MACRRVGEYAARQRTDIGGPTGRRHAHSASRIQPFGDQGAQPTMDIDDAPADQVPLSVGNMLCYESVPVAEPDLTF